VTAYRIYQVGPGGRLQLAQAFDCASDSEAIKRARDASAGQACELWAGGLLIGRFSKFGVFTPAAED
jgi:hypothetical protein